MISDPFANTDPAWLPFDPTAAAANADLAMPETTASCLAEFLRSDEVQKAIAATQPRPPAPTPERGWSLANMPTFPR
jgi:hypothetical protein